MRMAVFTRVCQRQSKRHCHPSTSTPAGSHKVSATTRLVSARGATVCLVALWSTREAMAYSSRSRATFRSPAFASRLWPRSTSSIELAALQGSGGNRANHDGRASTVLERSSLTQRRNFMRSIGVPRRMMPLYSRIDRRQVSDFRCFGLGGHGSSIEVLTSANMALGRWPSWRDSRRGLTVASATGAEVGESFNADELERMSYRELQALAKEYKVRANQKSSDIIRDLTSIARQDGEATGDVIPAAAVDGGAEPRGVAGDPEQEAGLGEGWKPAGEGYAMKVLDEDLLGFDLDGDFREQVDLDGAPARGRERKPPARVTGGGMDMTGLIGGVDQGDGWAKFGLRDGEAADVGDDMPKPFGDEDDGMADEDDVLDEELDFGGIRVVDIGKNGVGEGIGGGSAAAAAASDGDDDDASAIMERRIREALSGKTRLSDAMEKATPEQYGFKRDNLSLEKLSISVPEGHCPGCGAKFQSAIEGQPGFLPPDKLEELRARELELKLKGTPAEEPRDEDIVDAFESFPDLDEEDGDPGIDENARGIIEDVEAWLDAQPGMRNPDLDMDGEENGDAGKDVPRGSLAEGAGGTSEGLGRAQRDAAVLEKLRIRSGGVDRQQSEGVLREGEVAGSEEESEEKLVVCQRCHKLRFYGSVEENLRPGFSDSDLLTPKRFLHLLGSLREKRCLVIYLVDLFDFHGTFLFDLPHIIGRNPILVAGNKVDLLPRDLKPDRVRLWVRDRCRQAGLDEMETRDVHLVSSRQGTGVAPLMRKAREMALRRRCDIFVIGAANVGKSTFINYLIQEKGDNGGGVGRRGGRGGKKQGGRGKPGRGVTVSNIPGTTLDFLKVDLGERKALYDTPGLLLRHTFTSRLNADELRAVIPRKQVEHVTLRMGEGKCVLIGGLARIEVLEGRPFMFTFFVSNDVRLHPTDTRRVDDMLEKHLGKDKMVFPPYETERLGEIGEMVTTDFDIMGAGWKESAADVVIAGLGWVSITGAGPVAVRVWAPRGVLVLARDPLLPYESRETTAKFTGAATVKKGRKKQGRRV